VFWRLRRSINAGERDILLAEECSRRLCTRGFQLPAVPQFKLDFTLSVGAAELRSSGSKFSRSAVWGEKPGVICNNSAPSLPVCSSGSSSSRKRPAISCSRVGVRITLGVSGVRMVTQVRRQGIDLGGVSGEQSMAFHVEQKAFRRLLHPPLAHLGGRDCVERAVELYHVETLSVEG
jgi:hypothetical protein